MKLRVEIIMHGSTASTTVPVADAHLFLDALRVAWADDQPTMVTITDAAPGAYPMHVNSAHVQIVTMKEAS